MDSSGRVIADLAKFNALTLIAYQLKHQCSAYDTFYDLEVDDELKESINKEISKIVGSIEKRARKLNDKYKGKLVDITEISQRP